MPIDTIVKDPEIIKDLIEVEDVLSRIIAYEKEKNCKSGVLLIQRRQFGGIYKIKTEEEAKQHMSKSVLNNPRTCERGIKFYSKAYFEELKDKLSCKD